MKRCAGFTGILLYVAVSGLGTARLTRLALAQVASSITTPHKPAALVDVTVSEGTSMSVAVSPDGKTLAIDMQGSIWTLPATGGTAKRITSLFNDARQPIWSPDGKWITFFGYLDGGYNIWTIQADGSSQHKLTWGSYDDREPAYSHDGRYLAFASDRDNPLGSSYNIWILDLHSGIVKRATNDPSETHIPTWSADDKEIAFSSSREGGKSIWAVNVADGVERKIATTTGVASAPSWGVDGKLVYHDLDANVSRLESDGKPLTGDENAFAFRASWGPDGDFYYVSDGKIRKRSANGGDAETVPFKATLQVTRANGTYVRRKRDFDSTAPRKALGIVRPVISPDGTKVAFAALGDIYVMTIG